MIPATIVFLYLAVVVYIGVFAFRQAHGREEAEDYFLANRSLGPFVFLMSLFGTNMTAFAILGSSGMAATADPSPRITGATSSRIRMHSPPARS